MLRISTKAEFKNKVSKPYNAFLALVEKHISITKNLISLFTEYYN